MIYMAADNSLSDEALIDLNEMELAGNSDQVIVLAQVDRAGDAGSRRYRLTADNDLATLNSEVAEELGETNSGDPVALADFVRWGIENYPANRYGLLMWNHGAGWMSVALDSGEPTGADHLTLTEFRTGLDQALRGSNQDKLDVIGFDACLMGQLELFQAAQPYANFAVASEELAPGRGWDYGALLSAIYADPQMEGAGLANQMVSSFGEQYSVVEPNDFVTMSAVDLAHMPALSAAVSNLANVMAGQPALLASVVGDARAGVESYGVAFREGGERFASIDLGHLLSIIARRSPDLATKEAAEASLEALQATIVSAYRGAGLRHANGIAIYFPKAGEGLDPRYVQETPLPAWANFLQAYHNVAPSLADPPTINLVNYFGEEVGWQQPAYLEMEIAGRDIETVRLIGSRRQEDGRLRLIEYDTLIPEPTMLPDGETIYEWRDGVHEDFYIWYGEAAYISDGVNGAFAVLFPTAPDSSIYSAEGRYRTVDQAEFVEATLLFDTDTGGLSGIWGLDGASPRQFDPRSGDEFQLYDHYIDEAGETITVEVGASLFYSATAPFAYRNQPLPDGEYRLGLRAEAIAGISAYLPQAVSIVNREAASSRRSYLDPYQGFQFDLPADWGRPIYVDGALLSQADAQTARLTLTQFPAPSWSEATTATLKNYSLSQFGGVDLLYEDETTIAGMPATRTTYGYANQTGGRTGAMLTFIHDEVGYVLDIDGRQEDEGQTLAILEGARISWRFQPVRFGVTPGIWGQADLGAFSVAKPEAYSISEKSGWQIFNAPEGGAFLALRLEDAGISPEEALAKWIDVAGDGVANFNVEQPFVALIAGNGWARGNFSYEKDGGQIYGFVMVSHSPDRPVVVWGEANAAVFNQIESEAFLPMLSDLAVRQ